MADPSREKLIVLALIRNCNQHHSHASAARSLPPPANTSDHGIKRWLWLVAIKIKHNGDPQKIDPNRLKWFHIEDPLKGTVATETSSVTWNAVTTLPTLRTSSWQCKSKNSDLNSKQAWILFSVWGFLSVMITDCSKREKMNIFYFEHCW